MLVFVLDSEWLECLCTCIELFCTRGKMIATTSSSSTTTTTPEVREQAARRRRPWERCPRAVASALGPCSPLGGPSAAVEARPPRTVPAPRGPLGAPDLSAVRGNRAARQSVLSRASASGGRLCTQEGSRRGANLEASRIEV